MRTALLITCEHGGNRVPARHAALFVGSEALLESHRGVDFGSLLLARHLARALDAPLVASTVTRLLVDLNRSPGHRALFSPVTRGLPADIRQHIIETCYLPYRVEVDRQIARLLRAHDRLIHVSSHTFAAELEGRRRRADIGLLYDPSRAWERALCRDWRNALQRLAPRLTVRRNYPYRGSADGLTTALRRRFPDTCYAGIELEVNQAITRQPGGRWVRLRRSLADSLAACIASD